MRSRRSVARYTGGSASRHRRALQPCRSASLGPGTAAAVVPGMRRATTELEHYVLGDLLGRGQLAEVFGGYAVGDHGFEKPVVIKRLLPEVVRDRGLVPRLIGE